MEVKTWLANGLVFISLGSENGGLVRAIDEDKFVDNYEEYVELFPKRSRSKHGGTIKRKAIEKCYACKIRKPITEFNCYGIWECPCLECHDSKGMPKKKFTLPIEIWNDDFDVSNVSIEIGTKVLEEPDEDISEKEPDLNWLGEVKDRDSHNELSLENVRRY